MELICSLNINIVVIAIFAIIVFFVVYCAIMDINPSFAAMIGVLLIILSFLVLAYVQLTEEDANKKYYAISEVTAEVDKNEGYTYIIKTEEGQIFDSKDVESFSTKESTK